MNTVDRMDTVETYIASICMERSVLHAVMRREGLDPGRPLVANGVVMSSVGDKRTYRCGTRVLVRFHFSQHLICAVEIPGSAINRATWVS